MKGEKFIEKRRYPRIEKTLPLKIYADKYDICTETRNLSCNGVYCTVKEDIPPLTKLAIAIILPQDSRQASYLKVNCKGVVVRQEKNSLGGFNIAIFFNDINPQEKNKLARYINKHLSQD